MEAGESGSRYSANTQSRSYERYEQQHPPQPHHQHRDSQDRLYGDRPAMATAALISPSPSYHSHPPSFSPGYPHSAASGPSIAGMISPVEPRRPSDDSESSHRQSLPSISEVISGSKPTSYPPPPPPVPTTMGGSSFPYSTAPPSRPPFPEEKHSSPRPVHPSTSSSYPPRPDPLPSYDQRAHYSSRPAPPPLSTFAGPHPSPPIKPDHEKDSESHPANGSFPPHQMPSHQYPPGQHPLPPFPVSPRHEGPPLPSPYDPPPQSGHHEERGGYGPPRPRYEVTLSRHFEAWGYQESLSRIASSSRTIYNFAEAYGKIAQEQHGAHPIPERLPTEREVADMLSCADYIKKSLEGLRDVVLQNVMQERAREGNKAKGPYDDDDVNMYGDGMKSSYGGMTEVKKRRGRAAPPGRCHSCNRQDTPEWRRGPDGARTLCNACGLHYAKLERKRQLEARSLRPKPADERS